MVKKKVDRIVIDTSAIIEGVVSKKIQSKELEVKEIYIHEAVMAELEHQANKNRETGYLGIEEIKLLRDLSKKYKFKLIHEGSRPQDFEIKFAKSGEIDSIIRALALKNDATLITGDRVQALIAESKGIKTILIEFEKKPRKLTLEKYFDKTTMSVHIREGTNVIAKRGTPGNWKFVQVTNKALDKEKVKNIAKEIVEEASLREEGFIEVQRRGSTIIQLGDLRIVIIKPPLGDGWEITAVRPVKILKFEDYKISEKLKTRISTKAEGILIAGAPGQGKSTFTQALAMFYAKQEKIVKTIEAPRDLHLPSEITQYSISHGTPEEIHDILLLTRPDHTVFDEMRNTDDFKLYADLRLAGVGMIGVIHATRPVDSIQRFMSRLELGVIPQIIDTVIFIKDGSVQKVLSIKIEVRIPSGMTEADLARPIVTISDFETGNPEFEAYSYGDQTMILPIKEIEKESAIQRLAAKTIKKEILEIADDASVEMISDKKCVVYVPEKQKGEIIGKNGVTISALEKKLGLSIEVAILDRSKQDIADKKEVSFDVSTRKKFLVFQVSMKFIGKDASIIIGEDILLNAKVSNKGTIKIKKDSNMGHVIIKALHRGEDVKLII